MLDEESIDQMGKYKTLGAFASGTIFEILQVRRFVAQYGEGALLTYSILVEDKRDVGKLLVPLRYITQDDESANVPHIAIYRGMKALSNSDKNSEESGRKCHDFRRVTGSHFGGSRALVRCKADTMRRMTDEEIDVTLKAISLSTMKKDTTFIFQSVRDVTFRDGSKVCVASCLPSEQLPEGGDVYVPHRYSKAMRSHIPGVFIYRGSKETKGNATRIYNDIHVLSVEEMRGFAALAKPSEADTEPPSSEDDASVKG